MVKDNNKQQNIQEEAGGQETEAQENGSPEETEETGEMEDTGGLGSFFSPEAIIMIPLAVLLDLIGLLLFIFALDDFFITDIIGITMIGGWTYFRSGTAKTTKRKRNYKIYKAAKPLMIIGELIPYLGVIPGWTILVFLELKG